MQCKHCGFANGEDDHRCLRCGRRLSGVVVAAPPGYSGANALAPAVMMSDDTAEIPPLRQAVPAQPTLFANYSQVSPNVIPFDKRERHSAPRPSPPVVAAPPPHTVVRRSPPPPSDAQGRLDFIPASPL